MGGIACLATGVDRNGAKFWGKYETYSRKRTAEDAAT